MTKSSNDNKILYKEQTVPSWKEFINIVMEEDSIYECFWRGQKNASWKVESSIIRWIEEKKRKNIKILNTFVSKIYFEMLRNIQNEVKHICVSDHLKGVNFGDDGNDTSDVAKIQNWFDKISKLHDDDYYVNYQNLSIVGSPFDFSFGIPQDLTNWTWGQHYGIHTPLVDWSKYALAALFFATEEYEDNDEDIPIAVYKINWIGISHFDSPLFWMTDECCSKDRVIRAKAFFQIIKDFFSGIPVFEYINKDFFIVFEDDNKLEEHIDEVESFNLLYLDMMKLKIITSSVDTQSNLRLQSQGGLFTFSPCGMTLEEWAHRMETVFMKSSLGKSWLPFPHGPIIIKYIIKASKKDIAKCRIFLRNANITPKSMYPDFIGIKKHMDEFEKKLNRLASFNNLHFSISR